ncbi:MAG: S-methyl-5'-thioadenosine phosphorylase [archaeon]
MKGSEFRMIAVIGGTGLNDSELFKVKEKKKVFTPFGMTSDLLTITDFNGREVVFLPRHSEQHVIPPHKINFKANIWALKELGVKKVLGVCAVGSLKKEFKPRDFVLVDQFIDFGKDLTTFFDSGQFYHVSLAEPFCQVLRNDLSETLKELNLSFHSTGTYARISGPQFSTKAASKFYRQFADVIGMTGVPEAILCREQQLCYSILASVTDYDVWAEKPVNLNEVQETMKLNLENTKKVLEKAIERIDLNSGKECSCEKALDGAKA